MYRPMPSRKLSLEDLTEARRLYEVDGQSYRELGARFGVAMSTMRTLLAATGVMSRPVGWPTRPQAQVTAPPQPVVEIAPDATGRLRIPMRTPEERRLSRFTAPELAAIAVGSHQAG
jgi:hypothetical protein